MFEDIKIFLKTLPECPGVYLMKDDSETVIYVGKSKNLKNRISSYFNSISSHAPKVGAMVSCVDDFEYIITNTEMEALILEQTLIKKHKPRFNILLRDDKQYPYIKVTKNDDFPRVFMTRRIVNDKSLYYGPYTNVDAVKKTLEIIHTLYPIRKCSKSFKGKNERPCLNYHINLCKAPCNCLIDKSEYAEYIDRIVEILGGKSESLILHLKSEMENMAQSLNFERAALMRDYLNAIEVIMEKQTVIYREKHDIDCIGAYSAAGKLCFTMFFIRGGKLTGRDNYIFENIGAVGDARVKGNSDYNREQCADYVSSGENDVSEDQISDFVSQYYAEACILPNEIIVSHYFEGINTVEAWLSNKSGKKISINVPKRGDKKRLSDLVLANAAEYMNKFAGKIDMELSKNRALKEAIKEVLDISCDIYRIEAYDISNISGVFSVGAMVVYENFKKKPSDYRKFKIKSVKSIDDYASMEEILRRRFERYSACEKSGVARKNDSFSSLPDLILIDGGKAHTATCRKVLKELNLNITTAGMAKDDRHKTQRLYIPERNAYFDLKCNTELFKFITSVQDEVHRFSIDYHRQLRSESMAASLLDGIRGIGEKRKKALLLHFGSIEKIKAADVEELEAVKGMTKVSANEIRRYFDK